MQLAQKKLAGALENQEAGFICNLNKFTICAMENLLPRVRLTSLKENSSLLSIELFDSSPVTSKVFGSSAQSATIEEKTYE
jgi:hypothetical protein